MPSPSPNPLSRIPAVDKVLVALAREGALPPLPQLLFTDLVRREIAAMRERVQAGEGGVGEFAETVAFMKGRLEALYRSRIHPVINGTGVCIHTNLGRSPLAPAAADAVARIGRSYNNLEFDLESGERGKRGGFLERCLALLCDAPAATVTNNCAAALILILKHLAKGERNEVVISRGELVEIGGGFRVPEIMEVSGAKLVEVGATNKTSLEDYRRAITPRTGLILKVHRSNFYIGGFVGEPSTEELVALGAEHGLPVVEDLGSGAMVATESLAPIPHEPTAAEVLRRGVDLVCVSGDKLCGGPQAGIVAGRAELVAGIKKEPFFRALRCDKLILAAMQETALAYLEASAGGARPDLPLLAMLAASVEDDLRPRGEAILAKLDGLEGAAFDLVAATARCGGGTMPKAEIPSLAVAIRPERTSVVRLAEALRKRSLPVVGYVEDDAFRLDLRTVFPEQDEALASALLEVL
jgi:L-seryl-tRNA(Ser) seleniumtransferase